MTKDEMTKIMEENPKLCDMGWGLVRGTMRTYAERLEAFTQSRAALFGSTYGPTLAAWWLSDYPKTKTFPRRSSSYHLKHVLEGLTGVYMTNGDFIAGAIYAGFRLDANDESINVGINVKTRTMPSMNDLAFLPHDLEINNLRDILTRYGHEDPETADYYRRTYLKEAAPCST